jgi:two-component system chemotaxis sensor kinase CheA
MNEFIEQFLVESRELVEQAVGDLLALEQAPDDRDRLDSAFRAFHTLKGSAGIVDFAAMVRALDAAEDVLSAVRAGADPVTAELISDSLACLDQVARWLDAVESAGEPPSDAGPAADAIVARFRRTPAREPAAQPAASAWWDDLLARHPAVRGHARTAIRYAPDPDAFLRGEDPLALMETVPGLLRLDLSPQGTWPTLEDTDPFACQLVLTALASAPSAEIAAALSAVSGQVELQTLDETLPSAARELIQAQILMLGEIGKDGFSGRLTSAATVAANVLRHVGRAADAGEIEQAHAASLAQGDTGPLLAVFYRVVGAAPTASRVAAPIHQEPMARALRVDVERIDALVRLTGEMTVVKNAIGHAARLAQDGGDPKMLASRLKEQHALLERLVAELQRAVLSIRVLPLRHVFQRFPRLVREMGVSLGKPVRLATEGEDAEADKAIVESLFEPLLHVLRNAVDHGVEPASVREALGKPAPATIVLRAARQGEQVIVEVIDDGGGIDIVRVRQIAAERGVASAEILAAISDAEAVDLIFAPGFSTAGEVTDISGRGVGMDAVRVAVERLGGQVKVESRPGVGTTVRFTLPFTVIMTRVMTVEAGGQVFGIPLDGVVETVRVARDRISPVGAARAFVLRDRTLPLCDLAETLGITSDRAEPAEATVVIAALPGQLCGLQVERVGERMDVMLKPMDGLLSGMPGVAGTTLLGDGRVLIVLDLQELLQ